MPKLNNNFLKGKMNLDLDDKIIPKGEYREAGNISVTKSEGSDSGTVEQLKGFEKITNFSSDSSLDNSAVIGTYFDNNKKGCKCKIQFYKCFLLQGVLTHTA